MSPPPLQRQSGGDGERLPTLNLSGLGRRRRRRTQRKLPPRNHQTSTTNGGDNNNRAPPKKKRAAAKERSPSPLSAGDCKTTTKKKKPRRRRRRRSSDRFAAPPIPSSFVDHRDREDGEDALAALEADFFRDCDGDTSGGRCTVRSAEAVRAKLGAFQRPLGGAAAAAETTATATTATAVFSHNSATNFDGQQNDGDDSSDDDDDLFQPVFAAKKNRSTETVLPKNDNNDNDKTKAAAAVAKAETTTTTTANPVLLETTATHSPPAAAPPDDDDDDDTTTTTTTVAAAAAATTAEEGQRTTTTTEDDTAVVTGASNSNNKSSSACSSEATTPPGNNNNNNNNSESHTARKGGAAAAAAAADADDDDGNDDNANSDPKRLRRLEAAVRACYRTAVDARTATTGDVVRAVALQLGWSPQERRAHRPQIVRTLERLVRHGNQSNNKKKQQQQQQPALDALHAAVDRAFGAIPPERLPSCSVGEFVRATQQILGCDDDGGGVPPAVVFSKETKRRVKQRVAALLLQQQALPSPQQQQQQHSSTAAIPQESSVPMEEQSAPPLSKPTRLSGKKDEPSFAEPCVAPEAEAEPSVTEQAVAEPAATTGADTAAKSFADPTAEHIDSARVEVRPKNTAGNIDNARAEAKPKKAAPRRPRTAKAAAATKAKSAPAPPAEDAPIQNNTGSETAPPAKAQAAKGRKRARGAASCNLCAKCPCALRNRDSSGGGPPTKTEFAQSDAAMEKALMRRLAKLEETTDQYEEQTDAVRRRLKKHRREIWKKREALLKRYDERKAQRNGTLRFLPDVHEFHQQLEIEHLRKKRRTTKAVAKAQQSVFAATAKPKIQPTLTQMFGAKDIDEPVEEAVDSNDADLNGDASSSKVLDGLGHALDSDGCAQQQHNNNNNDDDDDEEISAEEDGYQQLCDSPLPAARVESKSSPTESANSPSKNAARNSVWDAVRNGNYNSSWDRLFYEEAEEVGVEHLLGLFGSSQQDDEGVPSPASRQDFPEFSQSLLSIRGKSLADAVTNQICEDENKRSTIELVCPNWEENVAFAMGQKDEAEVSEALQNVQQAQAKLRGAKLEILRKIEEEEAALGVFEESLRQSLTRFAPETAASSSSSASLKESGPSEPTDAAVPARPAGLLAARQSAESAVRTILSTPLSPSSRLSTATKPRACFEANADLLQHCKPDTPMSVASRESLAVASQ